MKRKEDWPELLAAFLHERRDMPFEWGKSDCCLLSADAILSMTGVDLMADFRGKYDSALSAARLFERLGGLEKAIESTCAAHGFLERTNINFVQRGDLVLIDTPDRGPACGICIGTHSVFYGQIKVDEIETRLCRRAWEIF